MDNPNNDDDRAFRPSLYEIFSGLVFSITGMPVSRLLTVIGGLLILGWAIQYATREGETTREVDVASEVAVASEGEVSKEVGQSFQYTSEQLEKNDFLSAVTYPDGFYNLSFPVQIEKLDLMIERCNQLVNKKSEYSDRVQEKLTSMLAVKSIIMANNGLNPAASLELFQQHVDQVSSSSAQKDEYLYLVVATYMEVLAADIGSDFYKPAITAISAIQETTPVPQTRALASYGRAMKYHHDSEDKAQSGKLLRLLGERMAMAKDEKVSDCGFSLIDYPNFLSNYQGAATLTKSENKLETETTELLKQIEETPPQSLQTYNLLMSVAEQHFHAGNISIALKVVDQLTSAASSSDLRIRDGALPKLARLKTRINLYKKPFPLSGLDVAGRTIGLPESDQTMIIFFNPYEASSQSALQRVATSPLREGFSTTTYLASEAELPLETIESLKKIDSDFIVLDKPTSEDWFKKSGIEQVPYLIRLDKGGVVQRLSLP